MKVVGLTGGIASGKSTVAGFFRQAKIPVLDADKLGHLVLEPAGEAYQGVVELFGRDILDAEGLIDRKRLGETVFGKAEAREQLEAITHPAISRLARRGLELIAERQEPLAIYEAALLVETGAYKGLDGLIVVSCSLSQQLARLIARDCLSHEAAAIRIAAQFPLSEKLAVADWVIENEGDLEATHRRVLEVQGELRAKFGLLQ